MLIDKNLAVQHRPADAKAALDCLLIDESLLYGMQLGRGPQPLDCGDRTARRVRDRRRARANRLAIHQHGTRAALRETASELWSIQLQIIGQHIQQRGILVYLDVVGVAVDHEVYGAHELPSYVFNLAASYVYRAAWSSLTEDL